MPWQPKRRRWPKSPRGRKGRVSQRILVALLVILVVTSLIGFLLFVVAQRTELDRFYEQRAVSIAQVAAHNPRIRDALASGAPASPGGVVATEARRIATDAGASYVVVIDMHRVRHSHPDPALIGKQVKEPIITTDGKAHVRIDVGATGRSANGIVPLYGPHGGMVGEVSAGIPETQVASELWRELPAFGAYAGAVLLIGAGAAFLLAGWLKRSTFGLELDEITGLYQEREAMLHGIREGVLGLDAQGRVTVINGEARRLLGLPADAEGRPVTRLGLDRAVIDTLTPGPGNSVNDRVMTVGHRLLVVNSWPTGRAGGPDGSVATLRDSTELRLLSDRAETARRRLKLLYDASGAVGTTLDLSDTAWQLARVVVPRFADFAIVDLAESVLHGEEPGTGRRLRMGRVAVHGVSEDHPFIPRGKVFELDPSTPQAWAFGHRRAVLETDLPGAQAWRAQDPVRAQAILDLGIHSRIVAPLSARGALLGVAYFWRWRQSERFDADDLSLAEELVARAAMWIDNARRYAREHAMAATLQRSLLPRGMPEQDAVDVAYRYLPAQLVGGDWFDVIPLPGARVALVVGDVVGHGLHAAATMGRLRTAVHNFSALDLSPDELLGHLDDLVARIDRDEVADADPAAVTGATCLYAIYDPTRRLCTMSRAAHPPPALVRPDGTVEFLDVPAGPPLGLVALPYQAAQFHVPEGSQLVLYTDGLIEDRERDIDDSLALLSAALGSDGVKRSPEETCAAVLDAVLPARPTDDIALLVARTRALEPQRIAEWEVPCDPAAVADVRARIGHHLVRWDLEESVFTTELILSELVTNAIRHATGPIRVRMLHNRGLICEVSDTSSTSPHLRYAATTDEGGRGLFLVAQLADRWGTRYVPSGKIIWAEQVLPQEP